MAITRVSNSVLNLSGHTGATGLPKGTEAQRPTPVAGMLRFNTETSGFEGYDGTEWGAIGGTGSTLVQDKFAGNGTTVAFTLSVAVIAEIFTSVYISGVYQEKSAYSISGTTITFSAAPPNGSSIEVITIDNIAVTAGVTSVNGEVGVVSLNSDEITEGATNKYLLDDSVVYNKLGTEFTTSIVMPSVTGGPLVDLYPGESIDVDYFYGTSSGSGIELRFIGGFDPNIAVNQLAGATFTFTGANIGSIPAGSYIIGSNGASFEYLDFYVEIVLNPTQQTNTDDGIGDAQAATILQASSVPTVDFSSAQVFTKTLTANENIAFTNYTIGAVKDLIITGDFTLGFTTGTVNIAAGTYDGTVSNLIQVICVDDITPTFWVTISQPQV